MERIWITEVELKRHKVLTDVLEGNIDLRTASELLGLSYRHTLRLRDRFKEEGMDGLLRRKPLRPPHEKITPEIRQIVVSLRKELYEDFNILHFRDKLRDIHGIRLSYESLRRILIREGLHEPRRKQRVYRRRRRMPKAGMLVQMDSSQHRWIEEISDLWWLVAMIDDADGYVYGRFYPSDTTWANMEVLKEYIKRRGLFMALYVDRASHFKTTRHGGIHYEVSREQEETQIQRALKEFNIDIVYANSPQAKGRIERLFGFFQDRLIKEMRLKGIKDYEAANRFLEEEFLPWYNSHYTLSVESIYRELTKTLDLELIFTIRHPRKVNRDNTVRFKGKVYQLLPLNGIKSFSGKWVEVCEYKDGRMKVLFEGKEVSYLEVLDKGSLIREEILNERQYFPEDRGIKKEKWRPPQDHPWRRYMRVKRVKDVTFQIGNKM
jgi:transposase